MAMSPASHGDEAKPSSVIPERPTAPDGGLNKGCCSAISPCAHQRLSPYTICETCSRSALAASAPSCPVGEKELETGQHLVGKNLGAISDTEKGAA
jgi:hypothetical protein